MSTSDRDLPSVDELLQWLLDEPEDDDDSRIEKELVASGIDLAAAYRKIDEQIATSRAAAGRQRLAQAAQERRGASLRRPRAPGRYAHLSTEALRARVVAGRAALGHRDFTALSRTDLESLLDDLEEDGR